MRASPVITFLSDYGLQDEFVGVCHGVIARICPQARVIDVTHGIDRHDVHAGAVILRGAISFMPVGVHLAVVDPEVGAERRAVALRLADGRVLVGPDNGLLWPSAARGGGVIESVDIGDSPLRLEPVSATFHGRDIFAPVAARLASGTALEEAGPPCDPATLVRLELPRPRREEGVLVAHAVYVDRFGNVQLDVAHEQLGESGLELGQDVALHTTSAESRTARYVRTFADVNLGDLLLYEDANRMLALAVRHGDAAMALGVGAGDEVRITPA